MMRMQYHRLMATVHLLVPDAETGTVRAKTVQLQSIERRGKREHVQKVLSAPQARLFRLPPLPLPPPIFFPSDLHCALRGDHRRPRVRFP